MVRDCNDSGHGPGTEAAGQRRIVYKPEDLSNFHASQCLVLARCDGDFGCMGLPLATQAALNVQGETPISVSE